MVHWLGEGTNVMICLAREPPLGPLEDPKTMPPPSPSSVYFSYDYGDTFIDKTFAFNISINGTDTGLATLDQFVTHPSYNTVSVFVANFYIHCIQRGILLNFRLCSLTHETK